MRQNSRFRILWFIALAIAIWSAPVLAEPFQKLSRRDPLSKRFFAIGMGAIVLLIFVLKANQKTEQNTGPISPPENDAHDSRFKNWTMPLELNAPKPRGIRPKSSSLISVFFVGVLSFGLFGLIMMPKNIPVYMYVIPFLVPIFGVVVVLLDRKRKTQLLDYGDPVPAIIIGVISRRKKLELKILLSRTFHCSDDQIPQPAFRC